MDRQRSEREQSRRALQEAQTTRNAAARVHFHLAVENEGHPELREAWVSAGAQEAQDEARRRGA